MILKIKMVGEEPMLVSWMNELPKKHTYYDSNAGINVRTHDVKRCLSGERKTAAGFIWKEVTL